MLNFSFSFIDCLPGYIATNLRYEIIFWGNTPYIVGVYIAQKIFIRAICGLKKADSCQSHFKKFKILTLPFLNIFEISYIYLINYNYPNVNK